MKIIFATSNINKVKEAKEILGELNIEITSLKEEGIDVDVEETGNTFVENAVIKAQEIMKLTNSIVIADDSGLEVDYINKEPGIYSARYLGEETSYSLKNKNIIDRLRGAKGYERSARFLCAVAAVFPDGNVITALGTVEGCIDYEEKGTNGFGYDPIFYLPEYKQTMAQISSELKNKISHRSKALYALGEKLKCL